MNIFKILSSYDGTINEPNISAFLTFLLNPKEEHGLRYSLLNKIIEKIIKESKINGKKINEYLNRYTNYDIYIQAEYPVDVSFTNSKNNRRDIDILIEIYKNKDMQEKPDIAICIENKITNFSMTDNRQLRDEAIGIDKEYNNNGKMNTEIYFILLCPEISEKIKKAFDRIENIEKTILLWKNSEESIFEYLKKILNKENEGEFDPINTEVKFIVKSFMAFIANNFQSEVIFEKDSKKENYNKSIGEYLKEIYNTLEFGKEYPVEAIKKELSELVEKQSGKKLNNITKNCQFYKVTVNDKSRTNYSVKTPFDSNINLFYYVDNNHRDKIKKFSYDNAESKIEVFWLEGEERVSKKVSELNKKNDI